MGDSEVESTSSANNDMPVEKILEAELAVEPNTDTYVDTPVRSLFTHVVKSGSYSVQNPYTPWKDMGKVFRRRAYESQMELPIENFLMRSIRLITLHPLIEPEYLTEGVWISDGIAHWILLLEIPTSSVADLTWISLRASVYIKWNCPLDTSKWDIHRPSVADSTWILHRGSVNFRWNCPLDTSTWDPYTLYGRFNLNITQG